MSEDTTTPRRIQRRRTKGWTMPDGAIYVGRPTRWSNPYSLAILDAEHPGEDEATLRARSIALFRTRAQLILADDPDYFEPLRGKDLVCWCALADADGNSVPCHADVLLELANRRRTPRSARERRVARLESVTRADTGDDPDMVIDPDDTTF